nr:sialate O-acetylesterase [Saprospiraceae bacterium]
DIHPRNKQDVGYRLSLGARKLYYGEHELRADGPRVRSVKTLDGAMHITFDQLPEQMMANERYGYIKGFSIAGEDRIFHWAKADFDQNGIKVWCEDVPRPVAVRYAWANNPADANLYSVDGLPASPFRTDNW